jgi:hypothetical protein
MLRSVSKKTLLFSEARGIATTGVGRTSRSATSRPPNGVSQYYYYYCCYYKDAKFVSTGATTTCTFDGWRSIPQPLPAVACDDYFDDGLEDDDSVMVQTCEIPSFRKHVTPGDVFGKGDVARRIPTSATQVTDVNLFSGTESQNATNGGGDGLTTTTSKPYPPPSDATGGDTVVTPGKGGSAGGSGSISYRKAGGGGGGGGGTGRHRCPKCGTTVTFRCDFEENTFYCASCSGWFVASPDTIEANNVVDHGDGSSYEEFLAKDGPKKTASSADSDILMRHVSGWSMTASPCEWFLFF